MRDTHAASGANAPDGTDGRIEAGTTVGSRPERRGRATSDADHATAANSRVDAYIADAPPYAQPILIHLRRVVHETCPDVVEEIKWRMPFFVYREANLCHMAAFKAHCAFGFWRGKEMPDLPTPDAQTGPAAAMGSLGRIESIADLPDERRLAGHIRAAMALADGSPKSKPKRTAGATKPSIPMPSDVAGALAANAEAARHFAAFSPSCRREYLEWIVEARKPETRAARIAKLVEQCAEGRTRHWKYQR